MAAVDGSASALLDGQDRSVKRRKVLALLPRARTVVYALTILMAHGIANALLHGLDEFVNHKIFRNRADQCSSNPLPQQRMDLPYIATFKLLRTHQSVIRRAAKHYKTFLFGATNKLY